MAAPPSPLYYLLFHPFVNFVSLPLGPPTIFFDLSTCIWSLFYCSNTTVFTLPLRLLYLSFVSIQAVPVTSLSITQIREKVASYFSNQNDQSCYSQ